MSFEVVSALLIILGTIIMLFSIGTTRRILALIKDSRYLRNWRILWGLMIFFAVGYGAATVLSFLGMTDVLAVLTGVIFGFGAFFVFLVVRIGQLTIEDLIDTQTSLAKTRDEALESSRVKSRILANVSHEFRTPLSVILGYTEILQARENNQKSETADSILSEIIDSTHQLSYLVDDLLNQSEMDERVIRVRTQNINIREYLDRTLLKLEYLSRAKNLKLETEVENTVPEYLLFDPRRLDQILTNLVNNAIKFSVEGKILIRVSSPSPDKWAVQVSDNGIGVPLEMQSRIFEPFVQADNSPTRDYGGSGLGLSIVKQLINVMGGEISLKSMPGKGSTFTILFPLLKEKGNQSK